MTAGHFFCKTVILILKTLWIDHDHEAFEDWVALRQRVLREPLGLMYSHTDIHAERSQRHLTGWMKDNLVGGLILTDQGMPPGDCKIRQVAVRERIQGTGIGRELMEVAMDAAREDGYQRVVIHSRKNVIPFYSRLGFVEEGEKFFEVGLPHKRMVLEL